MIVRFPYNTIMSLPRFFSPAPLTVHSLLDLPEAVARHACRVLRLGEGDDLLLFDGAGGEYVARILTLGQKKVTVDVRVACHRV